jgi:hypothetical protein
VELSAILAEPRTGTGHSSIPLTPPPIECPSRRSLYSKRTGANLGSLVLVGLETLKYYSERQNAHSQTGNISGGSETVVG